MTTAVASPPSFQQLPRLGWNSGASTGGLNSMSADDVSRMFMPQRKSVQRTNSSSSISSTSSTSSISTTIQPSSNSSTASNGDAGSYAAKKKARGGFWPTVKTDVTTNGANGRSQTSMAISGSAVTAASPIPASQHTPQSQQNGTRAALSQATNEPSAVLALLPMNGTFERKQINVPFFPDVLRIGRQTNAKTVPTPGNGFFDSKVLSRQHAEVWAERNGKIWIRDVKSSNGTFVNGHRLSPENRDSEPQELHQHDTLELGIDIVSEDQKVIVHHKVSAKVEYVGIPGSSNNVLDLNFGDLDPSQGGSLLSSPMSQPMVTSRGRGGAPLTNGRLSATSSVAGSHMNSMAQQRQMNFWSMPLNVEHLVKTLSTEMKAAKQQSQDLDQADTFLTSLLSPESKEEKASSPRLETVPQRITNGKAKSSRVESISRFSDPPAPPPQQPLPEKPDIPRSSPTDLQTRDLLKRSDTAKAGSAFAGSPTHPHSSQMLTLIEALSSAKKELDSQAAKVKQLEDMLKDERLARESAEERARRLEQQTSFRPVAESEATSEGKQEEAPVDGKEISRPWSEINGSAETTSSPPESVEHDLQRRLDIIVGEMTAMKKDMDQYQKRAEVAETDASNARSSLAEMVTRLRKENAAVAVDAEKTSDGVLVSASQPVDDSLDVAEPTLTSTTLTKRRSHIANGHVRAPSRLPEHLERALATVLRDSNGNGEMFTQTAPYASMLGVVLLGVGLMAYLNGWQKTER